MDLWIGARVSVQMKDRLFVQEKIEDGSERGMELFAGEIDWNWDSRPETNFRYSANIPGSKIKDHEAPYRIIDYLIIVPHSGNTEHKEIREILIKGFNTINFSLLEEYLDQYNDKFDYYLYTSWNVEVKP